ncbi:MAG: HAD-IC family P-type ATPase, partial [Stomatobaculum sp.]|nr:HAD-IC family P-type ATPase [Stomatobaculum sp.]
MKCKILHESAGRIRVHVVRKRMSTGQADILEAWLLRFEGIKKVSVFERTCDVIILYSGDREGVLHSLAVFSFEATEVEIPAHTGRALNREYQEKLIMTVGGRFLRRTFLPAPLRLAFLLWRGAEYLRKGAVCLLKGKLEVPVLDAAAISVAMARGNFGTAGSIMFMLRIGEILEEWTHRKSVSDLARSMSLNINKVWMRTSSGEVLVPIEEVNAGDEIVVRTGSLIPLDGFVCGGQASVNQASMTGESLPVNKESGSYVYAGTVVEEGELLVRVDKTLGSGRYDRAVKMIEESERLKSASEARASHLADRLVPWSLGGTLLTWFLTRNVMKTLSVLMVDFSCALKLAMPISTLSAMRECGDHKILVKGGRFLEAAAEADTIVFDKTGTLTNAEPHVAEVMTFGRRKADEMLRLAACLEEHYPHSIANAVVREAKIRSLHHEERHAEVEYVVAHGIASRIDGKKVVIGSYHFVL